MSVPIGLLVATLALQPINWSESFGDDNSIQFYKPTFPQEFTISMDGAQCKLSKFIEAADALYGEGAVMTEYEWSRTRSEFKSCLEVCKKWAHYMRTGERR